MIAGSFPPFVVPWLIRGLLAATIFLTVIGSACRQAPNPLLFASMNTTRATNNLACAQWAEPMQVQGLPNLYRVSDNLYRGALPTTEGLQELKELGVHTIIDLRESDGNRAKMAELGLTYEHIPMTAFHVKDDNVVQFLRIAGDSGHAPLFVHCKRGADRTGLMCAVYRIAFQGWTKDQAIAEMTQGGFRFNRGYQNVVNYIRDANIDQLKQQAGLTPQLVGAN
ncbi:MAG: tyrosine-protein phosphatase [Planctomycetes bacterium]|nr:tyrosine-protein phosphatase [Planctomycetota bacterium]